MTRRRLLQREHRVHFCGSSSEAAAAAAAAAAGAGGLGAAGGHGETVGGGWVGGREEGRRGVVSRASSYEKALTEK